MKKRSPDKIFLEAPTAGEELIESCGKCPWMKLNKPDNLKYLITNKMKFIFQMM